MKKTRVSAAFIAVFVCAFFGWTVTHRSIRSTAYAQHTADTPVIPDPDNYAPHYSYDGLSLAPTPMGTSEDMVMLTSMLDAQLLKFTMRTTKPNMMVTYNLEIRETGQPVKMISNFAYRPFGSTIKPGLSNFYVGVLPLNVDLLHADKVKCEIMGGSIARSVVIDNPFKGCAYSGTPASGSSQPDIPLLSAHMSEEAGSVEKTLVLRLKTKAGK